MSDSPSVPPTPPSAKAAQSQSIGNITTNSGSNPFFNLVQAGGDVSIEHIHGDVIRKEAKKNDPAIKEYFENAKRLIGNSYVRHREISAECRKDLDALVSDILEDGLETSLTRELANSINHEILRQFAQKSSQLDEYSRAAEVLIRQELARRPTIGNDVDHRLDNLSIRYRLDERAKVQILVMVGQTLMQEADYEGAEACLLKAKTLVEEDSNQQENPNIYRDLATLKIKQKQLIEAIDLLKIAKELYRRHKFSDAVIEQVEGAIADLEKITQPGLLSRMLRGFQGKSLSL